MIKIISQGEKFRELVQITGKGKEKKSRTYHEEKIHGEWVEKFNHAPSILNDDGSEV